MTNEQYEACDAALSGLEAVIRKAIAELDIIEARERLAAQ